MKKVTYGQDRFNNGLTFEKPKKNQMETTLTEVCEQARKLADVLKNCPEYQQLQQAKSRLEQDALNKNILRDLREQQLNMELGQLRGEEQDKTNRYFNEMYLAVSLNPVVSDYLNAEYKFSKIMRELYKIFGEVLQVSEEVDLKAQEIMVDYVS